MKRKSALTPWAFASLLCIGSLLQTVMAADGLQARLSASSVGFGDTVTLTLIADADSVQSNPDLSPLQKDFNILSQSSSSQTTIINGERSATVSWAITLSPTSMGKLPIPAISAGGVNSNPLTLDVVDAVTLPASAAASGDISVDVLVDEKTHYVHGEIPVTVRITDGAGLSEASLQMPSSSEFTLKQTGKDEISQSQKDGQPVTVMQRHYLLTPLQSGELTVPAVLLQGTVPGPSNQRSPFAGPELSSVFGRSAFGSSLFDRMFNPGRQIQALSKPLVLDIKANPVSDSNWFLPAKDVKLSAEWSQQKPTFKVGEAVTRTIRLYALGAAREKLPNLDFAEADGVRMYLDRTDDKSVDTPQGTAAVREFSVSIVPTRAGTITLPAIDVNWWNTEADEQNVASLPAETLSVVGGPADATADNSASTQKPADLTSADDARQNAISPDHIGTGLSTATLLIWSGLATGALVVAALLYTRRRRSQPSATAESFVKTGKSHSARARKNHQQALKQLHGRVVDACQSNQPELAYSAFRAWHAEANSGESLNTVNLKAKHHNLANEFDALELRLFQSGEIQTWQGGKFLQAFREMAAQAAKREGRNRMPAHVPALYPT